jgi:hypothetical protein
MNREPEKLKTGPLAGKRSRWIFLGVLVLIVLPDLFLAKKGYFHAFEGWPGFFALFGLAACLVLFLVGKGLEPLLKRKEDYYD